MKKIFFIAPAIALTLFSCTSQKITGGDNTSMSSPSSTTPGAGSTTESASMSTTTQKNTGNQATVETNGTTPVKKGSFQ